MPMVILTDRTFLYHKVIHLTQLSHGSRGPSSILRISQKLGMSRNLETKIVKKIFAFWASEYSCLTV